MRSTYVRSIDDRMAGGPATEHDGGAECSAFLSRARMRAYITLAHVCANSVFPPHHARATRAAAGPVAGRAVHVVERTVDSKSARGDAIQVAVYIQMICIAGQTNASSQPGANRLRPAQKHIVWVQLFHGGWVLC